MAGGTNKAGQELLTDAKPVENTPTSDSHDHVRVTHHVFYVVSRPDFLLADYALASLDLLGCDKGRSGHLG